MKKIAFVRKGTWPHANVAVADELRADFPEYELHVIDIWELLRHQPAVALWNSWRVLWHYAPHLLTRRRRFLDSFLYTPYIFQTLARLIREALTPGEYAFTFQMQSLFDASQPGLPHFVYTDHTHLVNLRYPGYDARRQAVPDWIALERTIYQHAAVTFVRSSHVRQSLLEQYGCPPERVQCVYFGSNAVRQPLAPDNAGYTNKTILFVGIDWQRKGGPELVAAFREVLRVHPDARLIIVGCSPKVEVPNCEVVGKIPLAAVSRYYAQASIFCLPTKLEPAGVAFIEALLSRLPIVATRLGAVPDFVEDGRSGCLVAPGDVGQLAEVLLFLLDRPETCRAFGERGLALALDRYRWEQVGRRLREGIQAALPVGASG